MIAAEKVAWYVYKIYVNIICLCVLGGTSLNGLTFQLMMIYEVYNIYISYFDSWWWSFLYRFRSPRCFRQPFCYGVSCLSEGCHKYARVGSFNSIKNSIYREPGSSDSIVIVSITFYIWESWEWQFFRVYLPCIDVTNLDLLELEQRTTRANQRCWPPTDIQWCFHYKGCNPYLGANFFASLVGDGGCWVAWFYRNPQLLVCDVHMHQLPQASESRRRRFINIRYFFMKTRGYSKALEVIVQLTPFSVWIHRRLAGVPLDHSILTCLFRPGFLWNCRWLSINVKGIQWEFLRLKGKTFKNPRVEVVIQSFGKTCSL